MLLIWEGGRGGELKTVELVGLKQHKMKWALRKHFYSVPFKNRIECKVGFLRAAFLVSKKKIFIFGTAVQHSNSKANKILSISFTLRLFILSITFQTTICFDMSTHT